MSTALTIRDDVLAITTADPTRDTALIVKDVVANLLIFIKSSKPAAIEEYLYPAISSFVPTARSIQSNHSEKAFFGFSPTPPVAGTSKRKGVVISNTSDYLARAQDVRDSFLASTFHTGHRLVTWAEATEKDHLDYIEFTQKHIASYQAQIVKHEAAIKLLKKSKKNSLSQLKAEEIDSLR
jgi:hypothetical protein